MKSVTTNIFLAAFLSAVLTVIISWAIAVSVLNYHTKIDLTDDLIESTTVVYVEERASMAITLRKDADCDLVIRRLGIHPISIQNKTYLPTCTKLDSLSIIVEYVPETDDSASLD